MSDENWKKMDLKFENLQKTIVAALKPKQNGSGKDEHARAHAGIIETMNCPNCTPPEKYQEAHYKLMGQKPCKDQECEHISKERETECEYCGTEF